MTPIKKYDLHTDNKKKKLPNRVDSNTSSPVRRLFSRRRALPLRCHVRSEWWLIRRFHVCRLARLFWKLHCYRVVKWRIRKCFWVRKKKHKRVVCVVSLTVLSGWYAIHVSRTRVKHQGGNPFFSVWRRLSLCLCLCLTIALLFSCLFTFRSLFHAAHYIYHFSFTPCVSITWRELTEVCAFPN